MPRPDPTPSQRRPLRKRFWQIFRLLAVLSLVIAAIAVILVTRGEGEVHASLIIGTAFGVGLTVLLGTSLMALMFLSAESGADEAAAPRVHKGDDEE